MHVHDDAVVNVFVWCDTARAKTKGIPSMTVSVWKYKIESTSPQIYIRHKVLASLTLSEPLYVLCILVNSHLRNSLAP